MAPHTWSYLGDTVSDATHRMYYRGQRIKEAYYRGEKIWGESAYHRVISFLMTSVSSATRFIFRLVGGNVKYSIDGGALRTPEKIDIDVYEVRNIKSSDVIDKDTGKFILRIYATSITYFAVLPYLKYTLPEHLTDADYSESVNSALGVGEVVSIIGNHVAYTYADGDTYRYRYHIEAIVEPFGEICENIVSMKNTFAGESFREGIVDNLFENTPNVLDFEGCFLRTSIASIPSTLFVPCEKAVNFRGCFALCSNINEIPESLFANNIYAEDFSCCFYNDTDLVTIPDKLFANLENAIDFSHAFRGCDGITNVGRELFSNCIRAKYFDFVFSNTFHLSRIPSDLFDGCVSATSFSFSFSAAGLLSVADGNAIVIETGGLFKSCINVERVTGCFMHCCGNTSSESEHLTLPFDLFYSVRSAFDFSWCFADSSIREIPDSLFSMCSEAQNFRGCFASCTYLTAIPQNLFRFTTKVTRFACCFRAALYSAIYHYMDGIHGPYDIIPESLFANTPDVLDFSWCFADIYDQVSSYNPFTIPESLFSYCPKVKTFRGCFYHSELHEVGDIFKWATQAEDFGYCFARPLETSQYDEYLGIYMAQPISAMSPTIFDHTISANNFEYCFYNQRMLAFGKLTPFIGSDGKTHYAPPTDHNPIPLWDMFPSAVGTNCYTNCPSDIVNKVPDGWK